MTTQVRNRSHPPTLLAGGIIVALCALSNIATTAIPAPAPVIVMSLVLAAVAVAALAGIWMQRGWGRWVGALTLGGTILLASPGITSTSSQGVTVLAVATVGIAAIGIALLLLSGLVARQPVS